MTESLLSERWDNEIAHLSGKTPECIKHRFGYKREKGLNLCSVAFYQRYFGKGPNIHQAPVSSTVEKA